MSRRKYTCRRLLLPLVLLAGATAGIVQARDIGIPPPDEMAYRADLIVEGRLLLDGGSVALQVESSLKGNATAGDRLPVISEHNPMGFSLEQVAGRRAGQRLILLGRYDEKTGELVLPWLDASIWPPTDDSHYSAPATLERGRELVLDSMQLEQAAERGVEALAAELLAGLDSEGRRLAVLGFLDSRLAEFVEDRDHRRALVLVIAGQLLDAGYADRATVGSVARLSPRMPASAALRYLLKIARGDDERSAKLAYAPARSVLRARRLIEQEQAREIDAMPELEAIVAAELPALRIEDARLALTLFDSPIGAVRDSAGAAVATMLDRQDVEAVPPGPDEARRFWRTKIDEAERKAADAAAN